MPSQPCIPANGILYKVQLATFSDAMCDGLEAMFLPSDGYSPRMSIGDAEKSL